MIFTGGHCKQITSFKMLIGFTFALKENFTLDNIIPIGKV
jgi:hypothetical protein